MSRTDNQIHAFEKWVARRKIGHPLELGYEAWHARDAEVAALTEQLAAERAATLREAAERCGLMHMYVKVGPPPRLEYLGFDHEAATKSILALIDPAGQSALDRERAEARLEEARWWYETVPTAPMADERIAALRQAAQGS